MSTSKDCIVHEIDVAFTDVNELARLIKILKADPRFVVTTSLTKFLKIPYQYHYWYSKSNLCIKVSNKDGKIFDLVDKLLKTYDKISDD